MASNSLMSTVGTLLGVAGAGLLLTELVLPSLGVMTPLLLPDWTSTPTAVGTTASDGTPLGVAAPKGITVGVVMPEAGAGSADAGTTDAGATGGGSADVSIGVAVPGQKTPMRLMIGPDGKLRAKPNADGTVPTTRELRINPALLKAGIRPSPDGTFERGVSPGLPTPTQVDRLKALRAPRFPTGTVPITAPDAQP